MRWISERQCADIDAVDRDLMGFEIMICVLLILVLSVLFPDYDISSAVIGIDGFRDH